MVALVGLRAALAKETAVERSKKLATPAAASRFAASLLPVHPSPPAPPPSGVSLIIGDRKRNRGWGCCRQIVSNGRCRRVVCSRWNMIGRCRRWCVIRRDRNRSHCRRGVISCGRGMICHRGRRIIDSRRLERDRRWIVKRGVILGVCGGGRHHRSRHGH